MFFNRAKLQSLNIYIYLNLYNTTKKCPRQHAKWKTHDITQVIHFFIQMLGSVPAIFPTNPDLKELNQEYLYICLEETEYITKGCLEVQLPTKRWKAEKSQREERSIEERRKRERERIRRKKIQARQLRGRSGTPQWFVGREGQKLGSLKRRAWSRFDKNENWKIARRCGTKHMLKSKCTNTSFSEQFWRTNVEKVHAAVARSTFPGQNLQNTPVSKNMHAVVATSTFPRLGMPKNGHAFPMQGTISVPGGMQYETKTDFRPSLRNCTHNRPAYNYFISSVLWYVEIWQSA